MFTQTLWRVIADALDPDIDFLPIATLTELLSQMLETSQVEAAVVREMQVELARLVDPLPLDEQAPARLVLLNMVDALEAQHLAAMPAIAVIKTQVAKRSMEIDYFLDAQMAIRNCSAFPDDARKRGIELAWETLICCEAQYLRGISTVDETWEMPCHDAGLIRFREEIKSLLTLRKMGPL